MITTRTNVSVIILLMLSNLFQPVAFADDATVDSVVQESADYYYWTHFVSGFWGRQSDNSVFPVIGKVEETKLAIFAKQADENTMQLAVALDQAMQRYPQLKCSFLMVGQEGGTDATTDEELASNLEHLRSQVERYEITKLSVGSLPYRPEVTRGRFSLNLLQGADVVLAVIEPGIVEPSRKEIQSRRLPVRTVRPFYRYIVRFRGAEMESTSPASKIERALNSLTK